MGKFLGPQWPFILPSDLTSQDLSLSQQSALILEGPPFPWLSLPSPSSSALSQFLLAPCWPWTSSENSWRFPLYLWWAIELGIPRIVPSLLPYINGSCSFPRASPVSHQEWVGGVSLHVTGLWAPDVGFIRVCYKILREPLVGIREGAPTIGEGTARDWVI